MKKNPRERFGKVISNVDGGVDLFQVDEVAFHPIAQCEVFDINMLGASRRLLGIAHGCTPIVVFVRNGCSHLWDVEVPKDAEDKERHAANITGSHKLCFGGGEGNRWLEFSLVCNGATCKLDADANQRATSFDTSSPVGVAISNGNQRFVVRAITK
jgi:hypothetical protein